VSAVEPHGEGVLQQELEKRKQKLAKLGYFDLDRKRQLPGFPFKIGVITASNSAAWNDFKKHVLSEYAGLTIYLHDAKMQGAYCVDSIVAAFERLAKEKLDIIVLTRGGGSLQELMPFNSQEVVEAIVNSQFPVITAIGHEIDITLADLAADIFVSTPTKAAEIISGKYAEFKNALERIAYYLQRVRLLYKNLPIELTNESKRLYSGIELFFKEKKSTLSDAFSQLELLSPKGTLKRGYSITFDKNGRIIKEAVKVEIGDRVRTMLFKGEFQSIVREIPSTKRQISNKFQ
jgi:exodeoxyribonuclease VII large subunit